MLIFLLPRPQLEYIIPITGTAVLMLMVSLMVAIKTRTQASVGKFRNPFRNMTVMLVMLFPVTGVSKLFRSLL